MMFFLVSFAEPMLRRRHQKAVGGNTHCGVMVKAAPASAFIVTEAKFLFEVLVIALDAPAHLGDEDQMLDGGVCWGGAQEVFERLGILFRPFDEQPLFWTLFGAPIVTVRRATPHGGETRL